MNTLEARRRMLGRNVYKRTTEGNPAIAQGSLARRYPGITMQGWTEQETTTGAQMFDPVGSVNGLLNADGSIILDSVYQTSDYIEVNEGESYYCTKTGSVRGKYYNSNKETIQSTSYEDFSFYSGASIIIPQDVSFIRFSFSNDNIDTIMLNKGSTALPYEPYTGGQPSPSPDYPQEIVSAGKYNEGTGKWEYEITITNAQTDPDKNQTVTLTSDRPLTKWDRLEKRNGVWGWVYKSDEYTMTGEETFYVSSESYIGELTSDSYINVNNLQERNGCCGFSNYLKRYVGVWGGNFDGVEGFSYNGTQIHVRISNEDTGVVAEDTMRKVGDKIKAYCAQRYADGTPFIFWHETTEETFVPLTTTEQEAMNALHTFRPTTVLSNDCECSMSLTYKTKKSLEVAT